LEEQIGRISLAVELKKKIYNLMDPGRRGGDGWLPK